MSRTPAYLPTLIELYSMGASHLPVEASTSSLGTTLGLSQQAISKHLQELEREEMIERRKAGRGETIFLTGKGADAVVAFYSRIKQAVDASGGPLTFHGKVFTGLGEGAYYMSLEGYARQFLKLLGFRPFPGTLNLVLDSSETELRRRLKFMDGLEVNGFKDRERTYGPVKCFRARVAGKHKAAVLVIERTHHGDAVLEVVSPRDLRKTLSLRDDDPVSVSVYPQD